IKNYNVSFYNTTSSIGTNLTNISGLAIFGSEVGGEGTYNFTCNITDQLDIFYNATEPKGMKVSVEVKTNTTNASLELNPNNITAENITLKYNYTEQVNFFLNNTGNGFMYSISIVSSNITGIIVQEVACEPIQIGGNCAQSFNITVTADAVAGNNYTIDFNVTWQNGDTTTGNTTANLTVYVEPNREIKFNENNLTLAVPITSTRTTNFTLLNYGNADLTNVTLNLTGNSTIINLTNFNNKRFNISKFGNETISVTVDASSLNSTGIGVYNLNITANAENCTQVILPFTVNITELDWKVSPDSLSKTVGLKAEVNKLGEIDITNLKETIFEFNLSISPNNGTNRTYLTLNETHSVNQTLINVTGKAVKTVEIFYDTNSTTAENGTYNYTLKVENTNGTAAPQCIEIPITFTIIKFTVDILSPTENNSISNVSANENLTMNVSAKIGNDPVEDNMNWSITIGGEECILVNSTYKNLTESWNLTCRAPNIANNPIKNDLEVTGNWTTNNVSLSDTEYDAIIYADVTSPWFSNVSADFVNHLDNLADITFEVNITDNFNISSVRAVINHTNGSSWNLNSSNYTRSNIEAGDFDKWNYNFTFSNPGITGDY
ncbi:MAG: hypothetical protein KAU95_03530, partial [Candidatus Aenigmarchaeota archaeon]|nr:hypothetical protein [Candidatus Aenigmarchaeota archaeon]